MSPVVGTQADVTLVNVKIEEISPSTLYFRCSLAPDTITGERINLWVPDDFRSKVIPSLPANWPPVIGDVWRVGTSGPLSWVIDGGGGSLLYVTQRDIANHTASITTDQALARFGTTLNLVSRVP